MRKLSIIALAVLMLLGTAGYVCADAIYTGQVGERVLITSISAATTATGGQAPATALTSAHVVYGFSYTDGAAGQCGLYDQSSTTTKTAASRFGEASVAAGGVATVMLPFPYKVVTGVVIFMPSTDAGNTGVVTVYYGYAS